MKCKATCEIFRPKPLMAHGLSATETIDTPLHRLKASNGDYYFLTLNRGLLSTVKIQDFCFDQSCVQG